MPLFSPWVVDQLFACYVRVLCAPLLSLTPVYLKGIIVKVMNKKLSGGKYYKAKGVVKEVVQKYGAKVRLNDSKAVLTLDQEDLETVIPKPGAAVLVVNGQYRGLEATLISLETDRFSCTVELQQGALKGKRAGGIAYEDICKLQI